MNRSSRRLPALLFGLLVCLVAQTAGHLTTEDESDLAIIPPDADNVEIHQVKFVNGVMQEDHPVIMYKEDFVNEDYDPTKNETSPGRNKKHKRTHHHRAELQTENEEDRILFDVLPDKPIVLSDDLKALPVSQVEAAQLAEPVKLGKLPKKYHSRKRRQAETEMVYDFRNGHYVYLPYLTYKRPPVPGKQPDKDRKIGHPPQYHPASTTYSQQPDTNRNVGQPAQNYPGQTIDINQPDQNRNVGQPPQNYPGQTIDINQPDQNRNVGQPPQNYPGQNNDIQPGSVDSRIGLIHDPNPELADNSLYNQTRPTKTPTTTPSFIIIDGPKVTKKPDIEFGADNINDFNAARTRTTTYRPVVRPNTRSPKVGLPTLRPNTRPANPPPPSEPKVSNCVWAIVYCCSGDSKKIRYQCFEELGCHGAFWDINPCADETVRDADLVPLAGFSPPAFAPPPATARRPSSREDAFRFPQEVGYQTGSNCHRASKYCCGLKNFGSQYDCFYHYGCNESISTIISSCS
ncbi:uncharacterized protein LOC108047889 isoform X2 [Drosophila rhopaloa]|uniref:Uncharacterized protein n=1 Tax=Drosophila rhopaloa TaxID=1041015 RepID=A0ABM5J7K4_DRORH|nr:uncharacterized protein LOC108047889 isoform X2 [Drosophila rhopaloa]